MSALPSIVELPQIRRAAEVEASIEGTVRALVERAQVTPGVPA